MTFIGEIPSADALRGAIREATTADEARLVKVLADAARLDEETSARVSRMARDLAEEGRRRRTGLDAYLHEYALTNQEGIALMCLAEALLRIPDAETADALIRDKVSRADWERHLGRSDSVLVNASTWGLMLTGRIIGLEGLEEEEGDLRAALGRIVARSGEPVIRQAMVQAMRILARQFVMGRTIEEALTRARDSENRAYRFSFDMLGEAAHTARDAERYYGAYAAAIEAVGRARGEGDVRAAPGVSVKLSALHPRYEPAQCARVMAELVPRLASLAAKAAGHDVGLTVDAEEAWRLDLSLDVIGAALAAPELGGWEGFGIAVQAYQRRAPLVIDWFAAALRAHGRRATVRLVKGAYWDTEIKRAQELGLDSYPVFTRKLSTDVSFIACARRLFAAEDVIYPQFASHNAHTIATVLALADGRPFEYQRLHGMGEEIYSQLLDGDGAAPCRVYAPVGSHEDLLPYLVRRLLENGANTSFVHRLIDEDAAIEELVADPVARAAALEEVPHPRIPPPRATVAPERLSARGLDLADPLALSRLKEEMERAPVGAWRAAPLIGGKERSGARVDERTDPADRGRVVGHAAEADPALAAEAAAAAARAAPGWDSLGGAARAETLERAAGLIEQRTGLLMAAIVREGGRTVPDALSEVREAVDFCRYYAARAREAFAGPLPLPGPTGESNALSLHGRGVFVCISPWNFPLAIFTGQLAAALAAGNAVIAKPAEQTPLTAALAVGILHEAGVPPGALALMPGGGEVGAALVAQPDVAGVAFTGSTETARAINRSLAAREGPIAPLIAETGGQNAMIVDSSALPEQVVGDVIASSFLSAGQRCSALRVLFVQRDIAERLLAMLTGAMEEIAVGDPGVIATDVGPVIDEDARAVLEAHAERMGREGTLLHAVRLPPETEAGVFFAPRAFEIERLGMLEREVFGPILHVIRYSADRLDQVLDSIRATGYGLTQGIHSRIDGAVHRVVGALPVGNVYVNRSIVGSVVGVQPFGGEGLSGTGPKAGGPHYLPRFAVERTLTVNTAAMGGNAALLTLGEG